MMWENDVSFTMRLPARTAKLLNELAKGDDRSRAGIIRRLVDKEAKRLGIVLDQAEDKPGSD